MLGCNTLCRTGIGTCSVPSKAGCLIELLRMHLLILIGEIILSNLFGTTPYRLWQSQAWVSLNSSLPTSIANPVSTTEKVMRLSYTGLIHATHPHLGPACSVADLIFCGLFYSSQWLFQNVSIILFFSSASISLSRGSLIQLLRSDGINLCYNAKMATISPLSSRGGVYFSIPWIWVNLVTCFAQ